MQKVEKAKNSSQLKPETIKKSVVIIDDNADILFLVQTILQMDGYEIYTAKNGEEALNVLSEIKAPDLIFLDMQMVEMSGPDFLISLEKKLPDLINSVPVVFLTGMDQVPQSKAVGCIRKPITDISQFLKKTQNFIEAGVRNSCYEH